MLEEKILEATTQAIVTHFYISLCCTLAARFIYLPRRKLNYREITYIIFWIAGSLFWITIGVTFILTHFDFGLATKVSASSGYFLILHVVSAILYVSFKVIESPKLTKLVTSLVVLATVTFLIYISVFGEMILIIPDGNGTS